MVLPKDLRAQSYNHVLARRWARPAPFMKVFSNGLARDFVETSELSRDTYGVTRRSCVASRRPYRYLARLPHSYVR